jgi:hypothetical protein
MKILKTKDSEIMNLYFHEQLKKQASAATTVFEAIGDVVKILPVESTLDDLAKAMGANSVEELIGLTGKSSDELEAEFVKHKSVNLGDIPAQVKPLAGAVVKSTSKEFSKYLTESLSKIMPLMQESDSLLAKAKNVDSLDDQAIKLLKESITKNKDELMREYTPLRGRFEAARQAGGFDISEVSSWRANLKRISDKAKELDIEEQKIIEKIKTPNASSVIEDINKPKISPATNINPSAVPTKINIKPFAKTIVTPTVETIAGSGANDAVKITEDAIGRAVSDIEKSGKFVDDGSKKTVEDAIKTSSLSGVKEGFAEVASEAGGDGSKLIPIAGQEAKSLDAASKDLISNLSPEMQAPTAAAAKSAKDNAKLSTKKTLDGVIADTQMEDRATKVSQTPEVSPQESSVPNLGQEQSRKTPIAKLPGETDAAYVLRVKGLTAAEALEAARMEREEQLAAKTIGGKTKELFKSSIPSLLWTVSMSIGAAIVGIPSGVATLAAGAVAGIGTIASTVIVPLVSLLAVAGIGYYVYNNWIAEEPNIALVAKLKAKLADTSVRLDNVKFKEDTDGHVLFQEISVVSTRLLKYGLNELAQPLQSDKDLSMIFSDIDLLSRDLKKFLANKDKYCQDLVNPNDCDDLTASAQGLYDTLNEYTSSVSDYIKEHADDTAEEASAGGITSQVGSAAKSDSQQQSDRTPYEVQIYDQNVDIAHLSGNMRMSAPRIIGKVFNTPEGMAFIDPANKFGGGFFGRTSEPGKDYLEALKYFYLNRIFDKHDLKKFIRANLPTASRRKMGNYKEGLDYYKQNPFSAQKIRRKRLQKQESLKNLHKNFTKSANVSMLVDKSGNSMKKQADQFSKEYFKDAVKSISEQYSKSYYEGFGKLYDVTPEKTSADYQQLYQNHQESGTDLIERAHPKSIYIADAISNGGLIENSIEQHRKMEEVAFSMPSGNFRNRYAELIENLVKIANESDEQGLYQSSELIEESVTKLIGNLK